MFGTCLQRRSIKHVLKEMQRNALGKLHLDLFAVGQQERKFKLTKLHGKRQNINS